MSLTVIGVIGVFCLILLIFTRMWIGASMLLVGLLGSMVIAGPEMGLSLVGMVPFSSTANYTLATVPMFVLMGVVLSVSGVGADLYYAASKWVGQFRGGLAMATVAACGFFAAVCGDSVATAVTMGKVAYPEMKKFRYSDSLAASSIAAGGTMGILIPPSLGFIIYGLITEQSIGKLFMAGIVPGILQAIFYIVAISIVTRLYPETGPAGPRTTMKEKWRSSYKVLPTIIIFLVIVVGLYGGFFTPTAAGAVGAAAAIVVGLVMRRITRDNFGYAVRDTVKTTSMVFFLIVGAYVFMRFMALSQLPSEMGQAIVNLYTTYHVPKLLILLIIVLGYLVVGCFLDILAAILLTLPIIYPVIIGLGFHPIWWGVIMVRIMEISMITPPYGLNLFVLSKTLKVPIWTIYKGTVPFLIADILHVALLIAVPSLAMMFQ